MRREIRALEPAARERFLAALGAVYAVGAADGPAGAAAARARYGPAFRSIGELVREHLEGAADRSCDHWHDDAGFLTHHVAFTLELEQSLQSVDPTVAVPYWDYTYDAFYYNFSDASGARLLGASAAQRPPRTA